MNTLLSPHCTRTDNVKVQVRDLHYNSGNLYPQCIIRHMLTKWTDHPPGICGWCIRMALQGLGMRKCVCLALASSMFTSRCISIVFCCPLFMLLLDNLRDLLMYHSLSVMCYSSAELAHVCQTVGVWIGKWLPN